MSQPASVTPPGRARGHERDVDPIAEGLRQLYSSVASEPVPDEFIDLLNRIDSVSSASEKPGR